MGEHGPARAPNWSRERNGAAVVQDRHRPARRAEPPPHSAPTERRRKMNPGKTSAVIDGTIAVVAAAVFLAVTGLTGDYTWVARLGGAGWVFLLSMIILMPTVMPWLKKKLTAESAGIAPAMPAGSLGKPATIRLGGRAESAAARRQSPSVTESVG